MDKIRIAYSSPAAGTAPVWTACEAGYFEALGLDVEPILIRGSTAITKAMEAGEVDLANYAAPAPVLANVDRGLDTVVILGAMNTLTQSLGGRPGIDTLEKLRGGTIGINNKTDVNYWLLRAVFPILGFEEEKDVHIKIIPRAEGREWMADHGVDCLILHVPAPDDAAKDGWTVLADLFAMKIPFQLSCIAGRRSWIEKNRDLVRRYIRGHVEGLIRFDGDSDFAVKVLGKWGASQDVAINTKIHHHALELFSIRPFPTVEAIQPILNAMKGVVPGAETANAADLIDRSFIEELDAEGYLDALAKQHGLAT
jgi:ABC-type nitrate/sulfonate/bicarbonate transport system substrate-binding protein